MSNGHTTNSHKQSTSNKTALLFAPLFLVSEAFRRQLKDETKQIFPASALPELHTRLTRSSRRVLMVVCKAILEVAFRTSSQENTDQKNADNSINFHTRTHSHQACLVLVEVFHGSFPLFPYVNISNCASEAFFAGA